MFKADSSFGKFEAYLNGTGTLGVAVSGGGDSVALLYALHQWGQRPLHVFCVDHGLNPQSAQWTRSVAEHAKRLGAQFTALHWQGDKPKTGLSAAAREARHALLADAARANGIHVLCLAHTADDILEAAHMRTEGSNVGSPVVWGPSPAWPQGRGVFLFRPLLDMRREDLRVFLRANNISWIDDPANSNLLSHRARARVEVQNNTALSVSASTTTLEPPIDVHPLGLIALSEKGPLKTLSAAVVSAGGGNKLPRTAELEALAAKLPDGKAHTLCGSRIWQTGDTIHIVREAGDMRRGGRGTLDLHAGEEIMWDGRFAIKATMAAILTPAAGLRRQLDPSDQAALTHMPAELRAVLPVLHSGSAKKLLAQHPPLTCATYNGVSVTCWVPYRFRAALGQFANEAELARYLQ